MATASDANALERVYQDSIGEPETKDEVYGYWLFVLGILAGFAGIALVMISDAPGESIRGAGIGLAALGLVLLLVGQIIRLPLKRPATMLSIGGAVLSVLAVGWFVVAFNAGNWSATFGDSESLVIGLYGLGILVMAVGSILTPLVIGPREEQRAAEARAGKAEAERDAAKREVARHEAEDERQAAAVAESRKEQKAAESRAGDTEAKRDAAMTEITRQEAEDERQAAAAAESEAESQSQFELYTGEDGDVYWRLRHNNGNIIADGSEGYSSRQKAMQGLDAVKRDAAGAAVLDLDETDDESTMEPDDESTMEPDDESTMEPDDESETESDDEVETQSEAAADSQSQFELYTGKGDEIRWRLRHDNGNIIANGTEGYSSRQSAMQGLDAVKRDAVEATVLDLDNEGGEGQSDDLDDSQSRFELYTDEGDEIRWRLRHDNGNIIANGSEGYSSRQKAMQGLDAVKRDVVEATVLDLDEMDGDETADDVTMRDENDQ